MDVDMENLELQKIEFDESSGNHKNLILIIYDITDNKRRLRLSKYLQGYGFRIQKSAFEAMLDSKHYKKLLNEMPNYVAKEDNVRVYKLKSYGEVSIWGSGQMIEDEEFLII